MPRYDPHIDPAPIFTVHDRLAYAAGDREKSPTTQDLQNDVLTGMLSFPTELLSRIFQYLANNADLAQVCKVCKRFFAIAMPHLYRNLDFDIDYQVDASHVRMLTRENTGLQFVRNVSVHVSKDFSEALVLSQECVRILINHIPMNKLRSFHWCDGQPLPPSLATDLWQRQRNLHCLEIVPLSRYKVLEDEYEMLQAQVERQAFPQLSSVRAIVDTIQSARLANAALQCGDVHSLDVDALNWGGGDAHEYRPRDHNPSPDDDSDAGYEAPANIVSEHDPEFPVIDPLTQTLFSHLTRVKPGLIPPHRSFTQLKLRDIDLTLSKHTWFTYLSLGSLKQLKVEYCKGADVFLLNLANHFPALDSFELVHYVPSQADRTVHALTEFLSFQPVNHLRTLKICLRNTNKLPSADAIKKHRRTLQRLKIDVARRPTENPSPFSPPQPLPPVASPAKRQKYTRPWYSINAFNSIIDSCQYLIELALTFPPYDLHFTDMDANKDSDNHSLNQYIERIVRKLPRLCTLNILNWPHHYKSGKSDGYYAAKNACLVRLAAGVFDRYRNYDADDDSFDDEGRHCKLEVVAFGVNERAAAGSPALPKAVAFVPSRMDVLGRKIWMTAPVSAREMKDHALDTDLLDEYELDFDRASRKGSHLGSPRHGVDDSDSDF